MRHVQIRFVESRRVRRIARIHLIATRLGRNGGEDRDRCGRPDSLL